MTVSDLAKIAKKVDPEKRVNKVLADKEKRAADKKQGSGPIVIPPDTPINPFSPIDPRRDPWNERDYNPWRRGHSKWLSGVWNEDDQETLAAKYQYHLNTRY